MGAVKTPLLKTLCTPQSCRASSIGKMCDMYDMHIS